MSSQSPKGPRRPALRSAVGRPSVDADAELADIKPGIVEPWRIYNPHQLQKATGWNRESTIMPLIREGRLAALRLGGSGGTYILGLAVWQLLGVNPMLASGSFEPPPGTEEPPGEPQKEG